MEENYKIWNEECITGAKNIKDKSVDLIICDPPFGINESKFDNLYKRDKSNVIDGYVEAPNNYDKFTLDWMTECVRILKDNGSMYIISGWTNLSSFYKAISVLNLYEVNHIIWKYNFGVNTKTKYVSSHYHIFYLTKSKNVKKIFNSNSRFTQLDKDSDGGSMLYQDLEDVWQINKEYRPGEVKNVNKLPNKLVEKIIEYSSNIDNIVCDFFMGNFTTADCSLRLGRKVIGFEMNKSSYEHFMEKVKDIKFGSDLKDKSNFVNPFFNQGKPISKEEHESIKNRFNKLSVEMKSKKDIIEKLTIEFGRGRFSIKNILDSNKTY